MRSNHAGETGAVWIYRGVLAVSRDAEIRSFAAHHLATEQLHLRFFDDWLSAPQKSVLLPLWRLSGFVPWRLSPHLAGDIGSTPQSKRLRRLS
jgi:ubiquinone biosynthesis monooxygenase Coq7